MLFFKLNKINVDRRSHRSHLINKTLMSSKITWKYFVNGNFELFAILLHCYEIKQASTSTSIRKVFIKLSEPLFVFTRFTYIYIQFILVKLKILGRRTNMTNYYCQVVSFVRLSEIFFQILRTLIFTKAYKYLQKKRDIYSIHIRIILFHIHEANKSILRLLLN